ncbi:MAG TPA: hypothetical protein VN133_06365 [Humibacter sp.]|nr:hypothetical protein [Humibacter sp.]
MDLGFRLSVVAAAEREGRTALARATHTAGYEAVPHRGLMRRVKVLLALYVADGTAFSRDPVALAEAERSTAALADRQADDGLFRGGDNVASPPDSAFTINDVCDAYEFTAEAAQRDAELARVRARLGAIAAASADALRRGGVHTPNHRWELSAALARIHRSFPDPSLVARVEEWLAEGVDIDADGLYSERSPNYAAHVTNPSLLAIARILNHPQLMHTVARNLTATLGLVHRDGTVETVQSRRQDQGRPFPLSAYLCSYRRLAIETGRGDFAWAALQAQQSEISDGNLLAETLLDTSLLDELPEPEPPVADRECRYESAALTVHRSEGVETVVYAGSDYPWMRRIRSGLANDPTFFRMFAGAAVLDSMRLSRSFFDLGPFRADVSTRLPDGTTRLQEQLDPGYHLPLPAEYRRSDGAYALGDDGRFSAAMSFGARPVDVVRMTTCIDVQPQPNGAHLQVDIRSPQVPVTLELAFRSGGVMTGAERIADGVWVLTGPEGSYRVGEDRIVFGPGGETPLPGVPLYHPGQDYAYLGGTDAAGGERVYIVRTAPVAFRVRLVHERVTGR